MRIELGNGKPVVTLLRAELELKEKLTYGDADTFMSTLSHQAAAIAPAVIGMHALSYSYLSALIGD